MANMMQSDIENSALQDVSAANSVDVIHWFDPGLLDVDAVHWTPYLEDDEVSGNDDKGWPCPR
jgi:hypothetical protein